MKFSRCPLHAAASPASACGGGGRGLLTPAAIVSASAAWQASHDLPAFLATQVAQEMAALPELEVGVSEGSRLITSPKPGYFYTKLVRGGPDVPARIWRPCACTPNGGSNQRQHEWTETCDRYPKELRAEINGRQVDVWRVWTGAKMTTKEHWEKLAASPPPTPEKPTNLGTMKPLF